MTELIWLRDGAELLRSVRLSCGMTHAEFADALTARVGWKVATRVERAWEEGGAVPPDRVVEAARALARPHGDEIGRRQFLRRAGTVATLTLIAGRRDALTAATRAVSDDGQQQSLLLSATRFDHVAA